MAAPTPAAKVANTQALATPPVPPLRVAAMPAKLKKIDPDGCAQWEQEQQRINDDWLRQLNTLGFIQQQTVQVLVRKG